MELLRPFDFLPLELVCRILCFLGPRNVLQLRLVSKLFRDITYDPVIWKTIYANARLPRPPGPFPSQPTRFLEQTLIRSERLAKYWTTQPIQAVSNTQIRLGGSPLGYPRIIGGRWLTTLESYKQIVFHDIETHSRQVLWEDTRMITSWDACSVPSAGGLLVYIVFRKNDSEIWKLLEFRVHGESSHLSHSVSLDVPVKYTRQSVRLVGDKAPFLYIRGQHLVFDTRGRIFYEFPRFGSKLDEIQAHLFFMIPSTVLLTNTHIIVISHRPHKLAIPSSTVKLNLIQAFTLPADPHPAGSETGILHLSHEGIIPNRLANLALARNSIIDSITESTSLRFLQLQPEGDRLYFSCVDLMLPKSLSDIVLPLSIEVSDIFTVEDGIYDPLMSPCGYYIEASDDGHARGFCRNHAGNDLWSSTWITKFTVDATGEKCFAAVGRASLARWADNDDLPCFSAPSFNGVIGRFCYLKGGRNWRLHGSVDAVVVDIM
ncbi:hypothetical protein J3R83DRAFT_11655 [Lanmaoa asiatica]|nr:hypothetical protein J3R83DRAFT_11655 [Lanmaoa asiatica]